jgi:hypothetical protein
MTSINHNPLNETEGQEQQQISRTAKKVDPKLHSDIQLIENNKGALESEKGTSDQSAEGAT